MSYVWKNVDIHFLIYIVTHFTHFILSSLSQFIYILYIHIEKSSELSIVWSEGVAEFKFKLVMFGRV